MKLIFKKRPFLKQTLVVFILFIVSKCYSQIRYERFVSSGFDTLEVNKLFIKAQFDSTVTYSDIKGPLNSITQLNGFDSLDAEIDTLSNTYLLNIDPGLTNLQFKQLLIFIRDSVAGVTSASEVYGTNASITGSDYFVVKLNSQSDSTILFAFATANLCTITGRNPMDSSQYYLKVDYDTGRNNLKLAYIFNDTNLFAYADAVLYFNVAPTDPTDDPMFGSQWWLRNTVTNNSFTLTSNTSYDIDADGAWAETTGCQFIRIAILDDGLIFNHPDINLSMNGYSVLWTDPTYVAGRDYTTSNNGNSYPEPNSKGVMGHGTKCAGVACALDNSIGGTGISPDTKVFAIKVYGKYKGGFTNLILANATVGLLMPMPMLFQDHLLKWEVLVLWVSWWKMPLIMQQRMVAMV